MKRKRISWKSCGVALAMGMVVLAHAESISVTGTSMPIFVDTRALSERRMPENLPICYSPRYATKESGSYVVIKQVLDAGTAQAVTSTVTTCEADAEGVYVLTPSSDDARLIRMIHEVHSANGDLLGELAEDVGVGASSTAGQAFFAGGTNALQQIAAQKGVAALAYSSDWADGVASVRIDYAYEQVRRGKKYGEGSGTIFSSDAPAKGAYAYDMSSAIGGDYTLTYTMLNDEGAVIDTYEANFSLPFRPGLLLLLK